MKHPENHIFEHTPETLGAWCAGRGMPAYRGAQILEWVYQKGVADPGAMSNLSKADRDLLAGEMTFLSGRTVAEQSASDGTRKLLIEWEEPAAGAAAADGALPIAGATGPRTECVMIPSDGRRTACLSSQVGCPVGCRFCASGVGGLESNLSAGRIVEQVWRLRYGLGGGADAGREDAASGEGQEREERVESRSEKGRATPPRITNVVFMGMGEPLSNFGPVTQAIRTIAALWGPGISARKITISTVGLPQGIRRLAERFELPVTLALSLHAPNDDLRRRLIPWAQYTTIEELLSACRAWFEKTGREITLEYTLLGGVNDRPEHAVQLADLATTLRANVNLIRYNEVQGMDFSRPKSRDVLEFQRALRARGVNAHIRASRGRDIAAACGQLRHEQAAAGARG